MPKIEKQIILEEYSLMSKKKTRKKRIYNPKTGRYYRIRLRSSTKGRKGTIMGLWKPPIKKKKKKRKA